MIQFNLLPDVKREFIRTQNTKRLVVGVSLLMSAAALLLLLVLLFSVYIVQKKSISDLSADIQSSSTTLNQAPHIADILTVQSQLNSLYSLNAQRPAASRLFGYLAQFTPVKTSISDLKVDYTANTMAITGNAPGLDVVNTFVDGLKFTTYNVSGQSATKPAFSSVVLTNFSRTAKTATYTITLGFDPVIFNNANTVTLSVGSQTQAAQQPSIIFKKDS